MDDATIASTLKQIYALRAQINQIRVARESAEASLILQYKVDECNATRQTLIENEVAQASPLNDQLNQLQASLDAALGS